MPATEDDDLGKSKLRTSCKARGVFTPRNHIYCGDTLVDTEEELPPLPFPRDHNFLEVRERMAKLCAQHKPGSQIIEIPPGKNHPYERPPGYCPYARLNEKGEMDAPSPNRRLKKSVYDASGNVLSNQRCTTSSGRPQGLKRIEQIVSAQKHWLDSSKKCFEWAHVRNTAWDNPDTYEEPVEPGKRASHPVCTAGVVATEHKRAFPSITNKATGIPPPRMNKAPTGNTWGGWAKDGAPGRKTMDGPWQVEPRVDTPPGGPPPEAEFRVSDARTRNFPDMKCQDTMHLTTWHLDDRYDIDPPGKKKLSYAQPFPWSASTDEAVWKTPAGKKSGLMAEGCSLPFYNNFRKAEIARQTAMSAR